MKIGVTADTHLSKHPEKIEEIIKRYFSDVDLIIHLGDFTSIEVLHKMQKYKKVIAVYGNNDKGKLTEELRQSEIINIEGYKIGLYHGHGSGENTMDRAYNEFEKDKVDIVIFGHSHQPIIKTKRKTLLINPGSPTKKLKERWYSYVLLEITKKKIEAKVVLYN
ncbi:putative phosphoesterase [Clostridium pascui]|uniref:metallophosphoesterase family protein n=1 Tax=Clostridium pascui TaxID=46609 RepID=UPI00195B14B5|nr:metallophosphoesterase family protein [Clostridium pascui]MBM7869911.1 putative phosphoesterase [Clostridium pascui]